MHTIRVETPSAKYNVLIGSGLLEALAPRIERLLGKLPRRVFVLTSAPIWALWRKRFLASFAEEPVALFLEPGEKFKTMGSVEKLLRQMAQAGGDRGSLLIAFGGGIVGDLGGFLAATYMRGIPFVQVPTTVLSQVDSSVGGKVAVNLPEGKNLVGAFYHPRAVFADIDTLSTLPASELRAGLQESVKSAIIRDRALFRYMEQNAGAALKRDPKTLEKIIAASVRMKAGVVHIDEHENGLRMILNLGHTVGHALELVTRYKGLLHGEAVGWGMLAAFHIAAARGLVSQAQFERMVDLTLAYGPLPAIGRLKAARIIAATAGDKKNINGVRRFILPLGIGAAGIVEDVTEAELEAAVAFMLAQSAQG